jgi:protein phosphatase PTC4
LSKNPLTASTLPIYHNTLFETLFKTFQEIDEEFLQSVGNSSNAGSTANISLFDRNANYIYIANTGDTRAVLATNNIAIDLSYDRKATDAEELARISREGGFVTNGRVQGILAVSRAFGDSQLKKYMPSPAYDASKSNLGGESQQRYQGSSSAYGASPRGYGSSSNTPIGIGQKRVLVVDPEISQLYPITSDQFLIIATDGLWDVMSSQKAVDFVLEAMKKENINHDTCQ